VSGNVGDGTGTRTVGEEPRSAVGTAADVVAAFRIRCFVSAMSRRGAVLASERTATTGHVGVCAERKLAQRYNGYNEWTHGLNAHAIRKITEQATEAPGRVEAGVMHEHTGGGRRMQGAFGLLPLRASAGVSPGFPRKPWACCYKHQHVRGCRATRARHCTTGTMLCTRRHR
jgi:hypothetical protein